MLYNHCIERKLPFRGVSFMQKPKLKTKKPIGTLFVSAVVALGACVAPTGAGLTETPEEFYITTSINGETYHVGDTVSITVTAINNSDATFTIDLGMGCTLLYSAFNKANELIYDPFVCTAVPTTYSLGPHETESRQFTWALSDRLNSGQLIGPGTYKIVGRLGLSAAITGDEASFEITN